MEFNPTAERKHELINGYINSVPERPKESLCRFYLRGLCLFEAKDCRMSHGINDLIYHKTQHNNNYKEDWGSVVSSFNEKPLYRGELSYKSLYESQEEKKYTLQEVNSSKPLRYQLRRELHRRQFGKFIELLKKEHQTNIFKEEFLEEEYYKVGFNKLMTRIKYGHLIEYMCEQEESKFFKVKYNKQGYIAERLSNEETVSECMELYRKYLQEVRPEKIVEGQLRGWMFKNNNNIRLPPMNMLLTWLKLDFSAFVALLSKQLAVQGLLDEQINVKLETDSGAALKFALQYIEESQSPVIEWTAIVGCVNQGLGTNNATLSEPLKGKLAALGYPIFYLPMSVFVYNPKSSISQASMHSCECQRQQPISTNYHTLAKEYKFNPSTKTIMLFTQKEVASIEKELLSNPIVGVDVEGRLRKNASIEIVQVRAVNCIYVFDFLSADAEGRSSMTELLRKVFLNADIVKVFHDSRHDSLAIHQVFQCCIVNVLDTSGMDIIQQQLKLHNEGTLPTMATVKPAGLNDLLRRYNAPNGINRLKDKFHKMMADNSNSQYFLQRPVDSEYLQYCIKDVEDLIYLGLTIHKHIPEPVLKHIGARYAGWGYLSTK